MPRKPDPHLEERILKAAQKLFLKGGEKALSMRSLAKAAHTNTPSVYRRFKNRKEILNALLRRIQQDLGVVLEPCVSLREVCQSFVEFMLEHPHEYQLANSGLFSKVAADRPNLELIKKRSAEWMGGSPEDYIDLILAGWALSHGTAMLLISKAVPPVYEARLRIVLAETIDLLVRNTAQVAK
ncbi:MAG TPA: TetR/AcrR family transcriptional regulator [Terriglobales bacterium]|nr:TetR/AcrR family transcriptional regulator [Terriglobales bacterium]HXY15970.1 TetR/AcrR family transcriptional regulator [Terriglobales bacterium]